MAVVEDAGQLQKFLRVRDRLPALRAIVLMEGESGEAGVHSWAQLLAAAEGVSAEALAQREAAQKPDDVCALIYTSGTTGPPKAVMMTHHNFTWTAKAVTDHIPEFAPGGTMVSYLPLSHVAEQLLSLHLPMAFGGCAYFERSMENLGETLRAARPVGFLGVPRVWEKIQAKIVAAAAQNTGLKRRIGRWARGVGLRGGYAEQRGEARPLLYGLAERLVFAKVRAQLGLDRCAIAVSSTAPISLDTLEFFLSLGIPICEVYGMSECTGPATLCSRRRYRTGKAGFAIAGTELRIAEDGEVCMRGPHVFPGYFKNEEATAEALDADGWLHSGDIGELDADGFLKITDRKKELIITAGGKNISPALIEGALRGVPVISQAVALGDRRKFISALVTLDPERVALEAQAAGVAGVTDAASAAASEAFTAHLLGQVTAACSVLSRAETVRKITILPRELSEEHDELTPTLKLKRRVIHERYGDQIEAMYS